jgi:hypothetical protein
MLQPFILNIKPISIPVKLQENVLLNLNVPSMYVRLKQVLKWNGLK